MSASEMEPPRLNGEQAESTEPEGQSGDVAQIQAGDSNKRGAESLAEEAETKRPRTETIEGSISTPPSAGDTHEGSPLTTLAIMRRPSKPGTVGSKVQAVTNYWKLMMDQPTMIFQYELLMTERGCSDDKREIFKGVRNEVLMALKKKIGGSIATDTGNILVSPVKLKNPETGDEESELSFVVEVPKQNEPRRKRQFDIRLRLVKVVDVAAVLAAYKQNHSDALYTDSGALGELTHLLNSLNVVFHNGPLLRMPASKGQWHYTMSNRMQISDVSDLYYGFTQSVKFTSDSLLLNFNSGASVFWKDQPLEDLLAKHPAINWRAFQAGDLNELQRASKILSGMKLKVTFKHLDQNKKHRPETVTGIALDDRGNAIRASDVRFHGRDGELLTKRLRFASKSGNGGEKCDAISFEGVQEAIAGLNEKNTLKANPKSEEEIRRLFDSLPKEDGKVSYEAIAELLIPPTSMQEYFAQRYNTTIDDRVPLITTGPKNSKKTKHHYLTLAVVAPGQQKKNADPRETEQIIKNTSSHPTKRLELIDGLFKHEAAFERDEVVKAFQIAIKPARVTVDQARILPTPEIILRTPDNRPPEKANFRESGVWQRRGPLYQPLGNLEAWGILVAGELRVPGAETKVLEFGEALIHALRENGTTARPPMFTRYLGRSPLGETLRDIAQTQLQLLVVLLPDKTAARYAEVKRVCDQEVGIVSQCSDFTKAFPPKRPNVLGYCRGLALKINAKVGGYQRGPAKIPLTLNWSVAIPWKCPTMVIGVAVSHPGPGSRQPSVAALTCLTDHHGMKYKEASRLQSRRQDVAGLQIPELEAMVEELVEAFVAKNGEPASILVYRDGVSNTQYPAVLNWEVPAFKNVFERLSQRHMGGAWKPKLTFMTCQKRNQTRLFPANPRDGDYRNGNFSAGLVVDNTIVDPLLFDFHLLSHKGLQGTSRPGYYHVLVDEFGYGADDIQQLTYALCYGYSRCEKSIGKVTPIYYAQQVAERRRLHHFEDRDDFMSDTQSHRSGGSGQSGASTQVAATETRPVHKNMENTMWWV